MISRTYDYRRIKRLDDLIDIQISYADWATLDERRDFTFLPVSIKYIYLIETVDGRDKGYWMFEPREDNFVIHVKMSPSYRGKKALTSLRNALAWVFEETKATKVMAYILKNQRAVSTLAFAGGFRLVSKTKAGSLYEVHRPE